MLVNDQSGGIDDEEAWIGRLGFCLGFRSTYRGDFQLTALRF